MPLLSDIYNTIDSLKRQGSNFIKNPKSELNEMLSLTNDRARAFNKLQKEATAEGMEYGPKTQEMAQQMAEAYAPGGITVWHGSPHKFARFDTSKMGTGEGSQVQGKGIYTSDAPETARQYAAIAYKPGLSQGTAFGSDQARLDAVIKLNANNFTDGDVSKLVDVIKRKPGAFRDPEAMLERIATYTNNNPTGHMYKVDLPDKHVLKMLDYDDEIKNQHKTIRDFAKKHGIAMDSTGFDLLQTVGRDKAGSEALAAAGIPGIKYNDNMRIVEGKPSKNYVVFDPEHLTILERTNQSPE